MPTRRFRSRGRRVARKRELIWFTRDLAFDADDTLTGHGQTLLTAAEWQPQFGINFDRATLLRIVGWVGFGMNALPSGKSLLQFAFYKDKSEITPVFPLPSDFQSINSYDVLHTNGWPLTNASGAYDGAGPLWRHDFDIKVKRKLDTSEAILIAANMPPDAGTPAARLVGVVRFLVDIT